MGSMGVIKWEAAIRINVSDISCFSPSSQLELEKDSLFFLAFFFFSKIQFSLYSAPSFPLPYFHFFRDPFLFVSPLRRLDPNKTFGSFQQEETGDPESRQKEEKDLRDRFLQSEKKKKRRDPFRNFSPLTKNLAKKLIHEMIKKVKWLSGKKRVRSTFTALFPNGFGRQRQVGRKQEKAKVPLRPGVTKWNVEVASSLILVNYGNFDEMTF